MSLQRSSYGARAAWLLSFFVAAEAPAGTCPGVADGFNAPGANGSVEAFVNFDDGSGAALYAGGAFTVLGTQSLNHVARWNGTAWSEVGAGLDGTVRALFVFDDGGGPALYAGGDFLTSNGAPTAHVARWTGSSWAAVAGGVAGSVHAFAAYDDGGGSELVAGGLKLVSNGMTLVSVARLSGGNWEALGAPGFFNFENGTVTSLAVYGNGSAARLFAAGDFTTIGGNQVNRLARFESPSWVAPGLGLSGGFASALAVHNDGGGAKLYVGGFLMVTPNGAFGNTSLGSLATWNGAQFAPAPAALPGSTSLTSVVDLRVFDSGSGATLHAAYSNSTASNPAQPITGKAARLDGGGWTALATNAGGTPYALAAFDDGTGPTLFAGGAFGHVEGIAARALARRSGGVWSPAASGLGLDGYARATATYDDGGGAALYVAGKFQYAGSVAAANIAQWTGSAWQPVGLGLDGEVYALAVFDDGGGPALYAGGAFANAGGQPASRIAKWQNGAWSPVGGGLETSVSSVFALRAFDDGSGTKLFVGGQFLLPGGVSAQHLARWDGAHWLPTQNGMMSAVWDIEVYDDGTGPRLFAGGSYDDFQAGIPPHGRVVRWTGSGLALAGDAFESTVRAFEVIQTASGPALYAGGHFEAIGASVVPHVARYAGGSTWVGVAGGTPFDVTALAAYDDGTGPALYAGFDFPVPGSPDSVLRLRCGAWESVGSGISQQVTGLAVLPATAPLGPALLIGGPFAHVLDAESAGFAWYQGCAPALEAYGAGCAGSGGFVPALALTGCPEPAGLVALKLAQGLGGSTALLFIGLGQAAVPVGGGCSFLLATLLPGPLAVPLSGSGPGAGAFSLAEPIPASATGITAHMQAFVLDTANPIGAAASNGVKLAVQ